MVLTNTISNNEVTSLEFDQCVFYKCIFLLGYLLKKMSATARTLSLTFGALLLRVLIFEPGIPEGQDVCEELIFIYGIFPHWIRAYSNPAHFSALRLVYLRNVPDCATVAYYCGRGSCFINVSFDFCSRKKSKIYKPLNISYRYMKKRVVRPKSSSIYNSVVNRKVALILGVVVLLISGLAGLFYYSGGAVAGKAFEQAVPNWAEGDLFIAQKLQNDNSCKEGEIVKELNYELLNNKVSGGSKLFCCPSETCGFTAFKSSSSLDYCLKIGTSVSSGSNSYSICVKQSDNVMGLLECSNSFFSYKDILCTGNKGLFSKCASSNKGKIDESSTTSSGFYCDGANWLKCDEKLVGTFKESAKTEKEFFCNGVKWVEKEKCNDKTKGTLVADLPDKDFFCDGKDWKIWEKCDAKAVLSKKDISVGSFLCDQSIKGSEGWKRCENKFCPLNVDLKAFNQKTVKNVFLSDLKIDFNYVTPDSVNFALDLFKEDYGIKSNLFYSSLSETEKKVYFKYKESVYVVQIKEKSDDSITGKVDVEVKSLKDANVPTALATINLALDAKNPLKFPPKTVGVDLEGDKTPEVYVTVTGFFEVKGGDNTQPLYSLGKPKLLVMVSPYVDVVSGNGKVLLANDNPQEFAFNGKHPMVLTGEGDNQVLYIDEKSNYVAKQYLGKDGKHYTSKDKTQFVNFMVLGQFGSFAIVQLSSAETGGGGLTQVYEDTLVANKELFFGMGTDKDGKSGTEPSLSVCANDAPAVKTAMSVCYTGEVNGATAEIKNSIGDGQVKALGSYVPYVLWYVAPVGELDKMAWAFSVFDISTDTNVKQESALAFSTNLVAGRRVALKVNVEGKDKYYLLSHPVAKYFDFAQLNITDISDKNRPMYKSEGDQSKVVFNLPLKKQVNVELVFGQPLEFKLTSSTQVKKDVDLAAELQSSVSTYGATTFVEDKNLFANALNKISVSSKDISLLTNKMRVEYGAEGLKNDVELLYRTPIELEGHALLYYHTFTSGGLNAFTKYADVYLFYDLSMKDVTTGKTKSYTHSFDDTTFILPLVKGRKMAFKLDDNYYLLKYSEAWSEKSVNGFSWDKLQLTSMDGVTTYAAKLTEKGVVFDVGQKEIFVDFDTKNSIVTFSGKTQVEFIKQSVDLGKEFATVLPQMTLPKVTNLEIIEETNTETIRNCDSESTKEFGSYVLVCVEGLGSPLKILVNQPWVRKLEEVADKEDKSKLPDYVLWFKGKSTSGKDVAVQKRFVFESQKSVSNIDWALLQKQLTEKKQPLFEVNTNLYELSGGKELSSFVLKKVPSGEVYPIQMESSIEGAQNGTIAIGENLVFFQQSLFQYDAKLNVKLLAQKLVTKEGFNVTSKNVADTVVIVSNIGQPSYKLEFTALNSEVQAGSFVFTKYSIEIFDPSVDVKSPFYKSFLPAGTSKTVLLPNGQSIIIEVPKVTKDAKGVSVVPPLVIKQ